MWAIITFATCFMLACVMLITGGSDIGGMISAVKNTAIEGAITSQLQTRSVNYYLIANESLQTFDDAFAAEYATLSAQGVNATLAAAGAYKKGVDAVQKYAGDFAEQNGYEQDSDDAQEILGLCMYVLNPQGKFNDFYTGLGETPPAYDVTGIAGDAKTRAEYRGYYAFTNCSIFLSGNMTDETNIGKMVEVLADYGVTEQKYEAFGFKDYKKVKDLSSSALVDFRAQYAYQIEMMDQTGKTEEEIRESVKQDVTSSLLASLPEEVSAAIEEIGQMNLFSTIVGSIFFKMAGLLLPIIYLIMTANALVAGQVDSGSMAYVLSSSVKRREVTFTQAVFLVGSLFAMFACTTLTSVVCLAIIKSEEIVLSYAEIILFNVGAFLTMFAMSGICFLASCWFNRSKHSMAVGGGITMFSLVATMLGLFGSKVLPSVIRISSLNYFNYVSVITLFDVTSILGGTLTYLWKFAILVAIGLVCYIVGSEKFKRKDLPL